ncbi:MAG TPA: metallophosphoesterase [Ktedonobacteraceae bacterium]
MEELQLWPPAGQPGGEDLLYFWALGDLHYCAWTGWSEVHAPRMKQLYQDLRQLWAREGAPAFCVSPGDVVESAEPEHYQEAEQQLRLNLRGVPFYPGLGNHELQSQGEEHEADLLKDFSTFWSKEPRYYWVQGEVLCVMLDVTGYPQPEFSRETLSFLETALAKHPRHIAILFAHCPLYNTVLARDAERSLDYDSLDPFFSVENSVEVRELLARHRNACLYLCGHTHTGWQSPGLVTTERLGEHPVTFVNLSSPWYTGQHHGAQWLDDKQHFTYRADQPDYVASLSVQVAREQIRLRLRDHRAGNWLAEWRVPVK